MLIERLTVDIPRPWGIMYVFFDLIKEREIFRKKNFFRNPELVEMIKHLFRIMGKPEASES
jgi:hypothetical protein